MKSTWRDGAKAEAQAGRVQMDVADMMSLPSTPHLPPGPACICCVCALDRPMYPRHVCA